MFSTCVRGTMVHAAETGLGQDGHNTEPPVITVESAMSSQMMKLAQTSFILSKLVSRNWV